MADYQRLRAVFQRLDTDRDGVVRISDLATSLQMADADRELSIAEKHRLLMAADRNRDNRIDFSEFKELVNPADQESSLMRKIAFRTAQLVVPKSQHQETVNYLTEYSCLPPPLFIILISLAEIATFIYYCVADNIKPEWAKGCPGCYEIKNNRYELGVLVFDPAKKQEAWRFLSYILIHAGLEHLIMNCIMQLLLGLPLEMVHKMWRIGPIYILGSILGSLMQSSLDPSVVLVGASGGGYSLITAHLSNTIMNWSEMEFRWIRLLIVSLLLGMDIGHAVYRRYWLHQCSNISYIAHFGGAITGLLLGVVILRNLRNMEWERVFWWFCLVAYIVIVITFVALTIHMKPDSGPLFTTRCNVTSTN